MFRLVSKRTLKQVSPALRTRPAFVGGVRFLSDSTTVKAHVGESKSTTAKNEITPPVDSFMVSSVQEAEIVQSPEASRPIYLDMQATTPTDPRVLDVMLKYYTEHYGNPHSRTHAYGWETDTAVEEARTHVANIIGADPKEIIFTSGATESNNLSIKGVARFYKNKKTYYHYPNGAQMCIECVPFPSR